MSELVKAIQHLVSDAEFTLNDDDYSTIVWNEEPAKVPTLADIEKAKLDLAAAAAQKEADKAALLNRLGISADEAKLLIS